jgi:hypothetical protein
LGLVLADGIPVMLPVVAIIAYLESEKPNK